MQNQNTPLHLACQKTVTNATHVVLLLNGRIDKYNSVSAPQASTHVAFVACQGST